MPGATATTLMYSEVVDMNVAEEGAVNFADSADYGHRVLVEMSKSALNSFLRWERNVGSDRPTAVLGDSTEFTNALLYALSTEFTDIDGVNNGLHYGTSNLSTNTDSRIREGGLVSMNDIALAFVLWKIYGSSTTMTKDNIYNLEDAFGMATNESVATAILQSFQNNLPVVDTMFRDLLATDPMRFFDGSGNQLTGLFETNADVSGSDSWQLVENDILEVKLRFTFENPVTRRGVAGHEHNITYPENAAGEQENQQTIIGAGDYFYIRLQLKVTDVVVPPPEEEAQPKTTNGTLSWFVRIFTTSANVQFADSVTDASGNIYVCGHTSTSATERDITFETFGTKDGTSVTNSDSYKQSIINPSSTNAAILVKYSKTGIPLWHSYISGEGSVSFISLGIDGSNNIYVMGTNFSNGAASTNRKTIYHRNTSGQLDIYGTFANITTTTEVIKLKYNSSGSVQWLAAETGFNGSLLPNQLIVDSTGSSYSMYTTINGATLSLYNSATSSSGTINTSISYGTHAITSTCISIVKRDTNGTPIWISNLRGNIAGGSHLSIDSNNNLVVLFSFGTLTAGNTLTITNGASKVNSSFTLTTWGTINGKSGADACIIKYSSSGSVLWVNHFYHNSTTIASSEQSSALFVDSSDNIYCIGTYQRNLTICNASSTGDVQPTPYGILPQTLVSGNPATSCFIVKINSNGQIVPNSMTNITATSAGSITPLSGVIDPSGNVYIGLRYNNTISLNNFTTDPGTTASSIVTTNTKTIAKVGTNDFVLIKYSPTFQVVFANPMQGISANLGTRCSLAINSDGKVSVLVSSTNTANQVSVYDGTDLTSNLTAYIPTHTHEQAILLHYD
jgi:hypothetical protein